MRTPRICSSCLQATHPQSLQVGRLAGRALHHQAPLQASAHSRFSTSTPRYDAESLVGRAKLPKAKSRKPILSVAGAVLAGAALYGIIGSSEDNTLNTTKFTPFNIVAREQVSPTAFIITIRSPEDVVSGNNTTVKAAWEHGLWSVEVKQPQLQIARQYTPLPPLDGAGTDGGDLRFLIRKMDSGEMSNYLSRLQVGEQVWLRGPHYGFDVSKRMGDAKDVVFLAGGTGVAPALQIAHKLLDGSANETGGRKPAIRILWANRRDTDSLGRKEMSAKASEGQPYTKVTDTVTNQIEEMRKRHGDNFQIDYFTDDERFISVKDINTAMGYQPRSRKQAVLAATDKRCRWHSHEGLAATSDEDDRAAADSSCTCRPHNMPPEPVGRNLLCVSGPDGFVEAYAGSKRWFGGREIQGPVLGLLGSMKRMDPRMDDWLVLKM